MKFKQYNAIRNRLYHNRFILSIYSFFRTTIPNHISQKKLKRYGYNNLKTIKWLLSDTGIKCFCEFGTLLGFIRDAGFIAYDNDIDFGVINDGEFDWAKLENKLLEKNIIKIHSYSYQDKVTEETFLFPDGISIDFFLYDFHDDKMITYVYYKDHDMLYENAKERSVKALIYPKIRGLQSMKVHNIDVIIPEEAEKHLEDIYGKQWRTPDPSYKPDRKQNILPGLGIRNDYK